MAACWPTETSRTQSINQPTHRLQHITTAIVQMHMDTKVLPSTQYLNTWHSICSIDTSIHPKEDHNFPSRISLEPWYTNTSGNCVLASPNERHQLYIHGQEKPQHQLIRISHVLEQAQYAQSPIITEKCCIRNVKNDWTRQPWTDYLR